MRRSKATPPFPQPPNAQGATGRGNFTPPRAGGTPGPTVPRDGDPDPAPAARGSRFAPRNWRVATRLNAILLIPALLALIFGGLRVYDAYDTWQEADAAERTAELVRAAGAYAHAVIDERDITARPLLEGRPDDPVIERARALTDEAAAEFWARVEDAPHTEGVQRRLSLVEATEPGLAALRSAAFGEDLPGVQTEEGYIAVQHPLMSFANELGLGTGNITSYGRTVYAVSLAKSAASLQRVIGTHLLVAPGPGAEQTQRQLTAFSSYRYLENIARNEYVAAGAEADADRLAEVLSQAGGEPGASEMDDMGTLIAAAPAGSGPDAGEVTPQNWYAAATDRFDAYHTIERELVDTAVGEARDIAATARRDMVVSAGVAVAALLLAFAIAMLMARSMSRSMTQLRTAALGVAEERLPALVEQLSRTQPGAVDTRVEPIPITSRDEIGEVSRAFDHVHREAVRLASEQALLRGNVNAIFTNLSTRNQGLIERQLGLIGELEAREADPEQLEHLFKLDHLATRMRRNGENLLVLAGEEPGRRLTEPVPLVDVVRAAASEVESYARIDMAGVPANDIHGAVVTDLVHLLAELLENAITFSSPQTKVRVAATRLPDGRIMIEIHDKGIGLTPEDFAEINKRLADPPSVDASVSQRMGLYVVGRLAERHGIRVQLRPSGERSGTTSLVMLPEAITRGGGGEQQAPAEDFTVSRIVTPAQESHITEAQRQAGLRTAAELGFDDSRYAAPAVTSAPPVPAVPQLPQTGTQSPYGPAYDAGYTTPPTSPVEPAYDQLSAQGDQFTGHPAPTESPQDGPAGSGQRVGFTAPDPGPAEFGGTTGAGLPRRTPPGPQRHDRAEAAPAQQAPEPGEAQWDRGPRREARPAGTTSAGLPRRVPRANLTEHQPAEPGAAAGPQVSRDPEDVRGRLSNLHRGVRQGRGGTGRADRNEPQGPGPGNTYDQER
ncbi:sensor histidine kinase [Streptomyces carpaticus]|uniref:histidine kinase n=1 Tax=Streptomyces carpaticus TaxID=285558 RepID=A0ABV4ZGJ8_9ACTN